jgi:uncharacterized membrane protein (UPF0182 family)
MMSVGVFGWQISRYIIEVPILHNVLGTLFLTLYITFTLAIMYIVYLMLKSFRREKIPEWSFEGKGWDYWKTKK